MKSAGLNFGGPAKAWLRIAGRIGLLGIALYFAGGLCTPCLGQAVTATVAGTVSDRSGAAIPGALLIAANVSTGVATKAFSDVDGHYIFTTLAPGDYTLRVEKEGFESALISGLSLLVYQKATQNVVLGLGQVKETMEVRAAAPLVDSTTASMGTVVESKAIQDLPLNLRQVTALALIVPGVADTTGRSLTSATGNGSGFNDNSYSGSGGRSAGNLLLIDGMTSRALNNGSFALNPPPEMVQEFKIQNNVYDAAFGGVAGTYVNLVTQSGSNGLHGAGWEFLRNRLLDGRNYNFNPTPAPQAQFIRNQFGVAVGGPILKSKLFFFGSYEGLRLIQGNPNNQSGVPSDAQRNGNFASLLSGTTANLCGSGGPATLVYDSGQLFDPATESNFVCPNNGNTILFGNPIPGNDIAAYRGGVQNLDAVGQKILALYPNPNGVDVNGTSLFINSKSVRRNDDQVDARIDWTKSDKDRFFARYLMGNSNQLYPAAFLDFTSQQHFRGHNVVGGWTRFFNSHFINDVRIGYQKDYLTYTCSSCPRTAGTISGFGIHNLAAVRPDLEEIPNFVTSNFGLTGDGFPNYYPIVVPDSILKFEDTLTWTRGGHTLSFGGDFNFWNTKGLQDPIAVNGDIRFNGQFSSLNGASTGASGAADLADLELGFPYIATYTQHPNVTNLVNGGWYALFANDNFHVNSRLTIEAGLRWEYRRQPVDSHNQIAAFYPLAKNFQPGDGLLLTPLPDAQNDALCSDTFFISSTGQCLIMSSAIRRSHGFSGNKIRQLSTGPGHGGFAPRLGLSWRPMNTDKLIVHAGGGIFFDLPITNMMGSFANNNPVFTRTIVYNTAGGSPPPLTNGAPTTTALVFENAGATPLNQITSQLMPSPFYHMPTVYQWSLSLQSQVSQNVGLEVGYVGNRGAHLDTVHLNGNQLRPGLQPTRPWPDFNVLSYDDYFGTSNYNALTAKVNRRLAAGLFGMVAYTYGKGLDENGGDSDFTSFAQDDNNLKAEYGVSDFSVRHRLVISGSYELPFGKGRAFLNSSGLTNVLLGGWDVSPIITYQTGLPFTVTSVNDFSGTNSLSPRPDRLCNGSGPGRVTEWFNLSCFSFTPPPSPRFGTSGRNILTGPSTFQTDASLIKRFAFTERFQAEFRAEFFNLFNHPNFGLPNAVVGSSTAGQIASTSSSMRQIQLGLKLKF